MIIPFIILLVLSSIVLFLYFRRVRRIKELESMLFEKESECFEISRALFQSQQFERIASDKLAEWVTKHDDMLIKYKQIKKDYGIE